MTAMRALLAFSLVLLFALPVYAADTPSPTAPAKDAKPTYQGKKDPCLTEKVSIEKGKLATTNNYDTKAYKDCVEKNKSTGCTATPKTKAEAAKCTCGTVTYEALGGKACGPISKCNLAYDKEVKSCSEGAMGKELADAAIQDIASDAVKNIPRDAEGNITDAGREQLSKALQTLGATEEEAQKAVQENPDKAHKLLEELSAGNKEEAKKIADELKLNADVLSNIARLEAKDLPDVLDGVMTKEQQDTARAFAQSTGFQAPENADDNAVPEPAALRQDPDKTVPLPKQSANDQIRSTARTLCESHGIQDCKQFENSMIATFYQECGGRANCQCSRTIEPEKYCGTFQLSKSEYANGVQSYAANCAESSDACVYVRQNCSTDSAGRFDHICNTAAASANHARIERGVQAATSDPRQQAAMHMMYQLMPSQTARALTSDDPSSIFSMQLNSGALSALCSNKVCFGNGATGGDAINGILSRYGTLRRGVEVATGIADPGLGGLVPSQSSVFRGTDILARNGASPFSQTIPFTSSTQYQPQQTAYYQPGTGGYAGGSSGGYYPGTQQQTVQQQQQPLSQTILQDGNIQSGGNVQQTIQAVASIIAQPREVARGNPIIVSWSSVGTNPSAPCEVFLRSGTGTSSVARGNEGSQKVPTSGAATVPVVWGFTLQCTALSGMQLIQQATSVSIK